MWLTHTSSDDAESKLPGANTSDDGAESSCSVQISPEPMTRWRRYTRPMMTLNLACYLVYTPQIQDAESKSITECGSDISLLGR